MKRQKNKQTHNLKRQRKHETRSLRYGRDDGLIPGIKITTIRGRQDGSRGLILRIHGGAHTETHRKGRDENRAGPPS